MLLTFSMCLSWSYANGSENPAFHSLYLGVLGGYASTTWDGLVPNSKKQNAALNMSTPVEVKEGGDAWGVFAGYEITPHFALETTYLHYSDAKIFFDNTSLFTFEHDNLTHFVTQTESFSLMAKLMIFLPNTKVRLFSSAGIANVHRKDLLVNDWHLGPTFGLGLNYHFNEHFMAEFGGNYIAGYGESQLSPADTYYPFLYSATFRLAYYF